MELIPIYLNHTRHFVLKIYKSICSSEYQIQILLFGPTILIVFEYQIVHQTLDDIISRVDIERTSYQGLRFKEYHIKGWDWESAISMVDVERTSYWGSDWENIIMRVNIKMPSYQGVDRDWKNILSRVYI